MIDLVRREVRQVPFSGSRTAKGPATFGQTDILQWYGQQPDSPDVWVPVTLALPRNGQKLAHVLSALARLVERHEVLRTVYPEFPSPVQHVVGSGRLGVHLCSLPRQAAAAEVSRTELDEALRAYVVSRLPRLYDHTELPLHIALALRGDSVIAGIVEIAHAAVDYQAAAVVGDELAVLLRSPRTPSGGAPPYQPLERAADERTGEAAGSAAAALRNWEEWLRRVPPSPYPIERTAEAGTPLMGKLHSRALAIGVTRLSRRTGLSRPSVLLAAVSAVLSRRTGYAETALTAMAANRSGPRLSDYVGTLAQVTPMTVRVAGAGFDELVRRSWAATIRAGMRGAYDAQLRQAIAARVQEERGVVFCFDPVFNYYSAAAHSVQDVPSGLTWEPRGVTTEAPVRFECFDATDHVVLRLWGGHPGHLSRAETEALLRAVERLVLKASLRDLSAEEVTEAVALRTVDRGADWVLVDSCWIQLSEVQRLLDDVFGAGRAHVSCDTGRQLVAHVRAGSTAASARTAHQACMKALPGRLNAMAPARYILCDGAPGPAAACHGRVVDDGSGRTPSDSSEPWNSGDGLHVRH
ncbi:condensation domain-containing protein [Streptomyces sp. S.PNR 29]|uniref:condensation domain-containing protein n=1 Tax=Streptomyces sp. S.PNR 29 TaxID=2973805 RepID=UPI0025B0E837|nr:condensation domain-containing protein [Streptomyces sp. S.PNR 29]MDN0201120.1 condensation domain-containing protein [Streptomyces sp. S.PNR 29]